MLNFLLCSAIAPDGKERRSFDDDFQGAGKSKASPVMRRNCAGYLRPVLEILEPTVLVIQGQGVRQWTAPALGLPPKGPLHARSVIGGIGVDIMTFDHPSAPGRSGWWGRSPGSAYLRKVVAPAIQTWRAGCP